MKVLSVIGTLFPKFRKLQKFGCFTENSANSKQVANEQQTENKQEEYFFYREVQLNKLFPRIKISHSLA